MKSCDIKEDTTTLIYAIRLSLQPNVQGKMVKHYLLGSVFFESTMDAFDMMFASTKDRGSYKIEEVDTNCNCLSALNLLESPPFSFL